MRLTSDTPSIANADIQPVARYFHSVIGEQHFHRLRINKARYIFQLQSTRCGQSSRHQGQCGVLRTADSDAPLQRHAALNLQTIHDRLRLRQQRFQTRATCLYQTALPHLAAHPSLFCLLRANRKRPAALHRAALGTGLSGGADSRAVPVPGVRPGWSVLMSRRLLVLFCRGALSPLDISMTHRGALSPLDISMTHICIAKTPHIDNSDLEHPLKIGVVSTSARSVVCPLTTWQPWTAFKDILWQYVALR